ncbi:YceI family protein [Mycobacterium sherrisii]|uniref:YceI family protein n=1 Tax=Mycobacterium sherrisii TaxID=243061 RepID=UPI000A14C06D|nr:YceI family protein [Mycobacterium sherrisii]MCV7031445.1 YceI family protein [Mycobacterium sherrisii]ORW87332.1 S-adenosyl-L-methionine-dependent methyltransferase [Mycobacterium sherrisii]
MTRSWTLDAADGDLLLRTGVTGRAARLGHRLTIAMMRWRATVEWSGDDPVGAELVVDADSFEVIGSQGGVKGLSGPEKALVRSNALSSLDARRFPQIRYVAGGIEKTTRGYRLAGTLTLRGRRREHVIDLRTEDLGASWQMSAQSRILQSDYGIKLVSLLMGSVQVADEVAVEFEAVHAKGE